MVVTPLTAADIAFAVLALSKSAWKLGISVSNLDQDTRIVDTTVKNLAGEVKSLGNECDLVYAELEEVVSQSETGKVLPYDVNGGMWDCLVTQADEANRTMQELEQFVKMVRGEESILTSQIQRQRRLDQSKNQIASIRTKVCRHTDNLQATLVLINT
jgi:prophage DNA circulation protein